MDRKINLSNNKRIAKNTLYLYFRLLFVMIINLYTSRLVLSILGVVDYGIYSVVGGFVAMFSMFSGSMSAAVSRFLTIEIGREDENKIKEIFSSAKTIHLLLGLFIVFLGEILGVWFLNNKMSIPVDRITAANYVFQFSLITFFFNLISIPYKSAIIANEKMKLFAIIGIVEVSMILIIVFLIPFFSFDYLILYSFFLFLVSVVIRGALIYYAKKKIANLNCGYGLHKKIITDLGGFAGWNFIGSTSTILSTQGINILLNIFYGPVVNAGRGISIQVNNAVSSFVNNFILAINPQITKSYALKDFKQMKFLIFQGARFSSYMLTFLSLPLFFNTETILNLWLNEVPLHTVNFTRLVLLFLLIESLSNPLITGMLATGKIRNYQIIVGFTLSLNFPITYFFLKMGFAPDIAFIIPIIISHFCLAIRLIMLSKVIGFNILSFLNQVYLNGVLVFIISAIFPYIAHKYFFEDAKYLNLITTTLSAFLSISITIYLYGLNKNEKKYVLNKVNSLHLILSKILWKR